MDRWTNGRVPPYLPPPAGLERLEVVAEIRRVPHEVVQQLGDVVVEVPRAKVRRRAVRGGIRLASLGVLLEVGDVLGHGQTKLLSRAVVSHDLEIAVRLREVIELPLGRRGPLGDDVR